VQGVRSLVERAASHELGLAERVEAFGELVMQFQDMAVGYAYAVLGDFHQAEDAAQDAFITAYRTIDTLREPAAFAGWFRRLVRTACDRHTRRPRLPIVPLEAAAGMGSAADAPDRAAERAEMREHILQLIRELPQEQRAATTLFYINGYSHKEIADFLEVPETTVNNRLHASREKLKEKTMDLVKDTLHEHAPDEGFSKKVIDELLTRPKPLEIADHPIRKAWDAIRAALVGYELVEGDEIETRGAFDAVLEDMYRAYRVDGDKALRTQMSVTTFKAIRGRTPPVRLLAAGRVFRPETEDERHLKVFCQADGICVERGATVASPKNTCTAVLRSVFGEVELRWRQGSFPFVDDALEVDVRHEGEWLEIMGAGMLKPATLRDAGHNPDAVSGYAFGIGLERIAMMSAGIADIRDLWRAPYVPE
jgi:RNA polymerase sigma factor (sigma-70 family)